MKYAVHYSCDTASPEAYITVFDESSSKSYGFSELTDTDDPNQEWHVSAVKSLAANSISWTGYGILDNINYLYMQTI